jgi:hypothetical protein
LAPEETPVEVIREREQRAAVLVAVQDKLRGGDAGERAWYGTQPERFDRFHSPENISGYGYVRRR